MLLENNTERVMNLVDIIDDLNYRGLIKDYSNEKIK